MIEKMPKHFKFAHTAVMVLVIAAIATFSALADGTDGTTSAGLDAASTEALQKTVQDLQTGAHRDDIIQKDPAAQNADSQVQALSGGDPGTTQEMYGLSADVFEQIVKDSGGQVQKMQEIMNEAQANPQQFYQKYFSEQDKAKLEGMSRRISNVPSASQPTGAVPQISATLVPPANTPHSP